MPERPRKTKSRRVRPWRVLQSPIHGRGVFAARTIRKGETIIEYRGKRTSYEDACEGPDSDPDNPYHTFLFSLDDGRVIDASVRGNAARWINHSCEPNCEPIAFGDHMWIVAVRAIRPGEELAYDYAIELDEPHTPARKRRFPCACGARRCRGSILKPKRQPLHPLVRRAIRRYGPGR